MKEETNDGMKDGFSDILKEIKERFRSPFFSAFIITWIFHNWKVTVALIWYKAEDLKYFKDFDGEIYNSYFDLIYKNVKTSDGIWFPLLYACLYAFLIAPLLRYMFNYINAVVTRESSKIVKAKGEGGFVTVESYVAQEEEYNRKGKLLQDRIVLYEKYITENEILKNDKIELITKEMESTKRIKILETDNKTLQMDSILYNKQLAIEEEGIKPLIGIWTLNEKRSNDYSESYFRNNLGKLFNIEISGGKISIIRNANSSSYVIIYFNYSFVTKKYSIVYYDNGSKACHLYEFKLLGEFLYHVEIDGVGEYYLTEVDPNEDGIVEGESVTL